MQPRLFMSLPPIIRHQSKTIDLKRRMQKFMNEVIYGCRNVFRFQL